MENLNNQLFALKKRAKESKDFFARTNYRESDLAVTSSMEFSSLRKEERASSSAVVLKNDKTRGIAAVLGKVMKAKTKP